MDAAAVDALVGAVTGASVTVLLGQVMQWFNEQRAGRRAARLIRWELFQNDALLKDIILNGPALPPLLPQSSRWHSCGDAFASVADLGALEDVQHGYDIVLLLDQTVSDVASGALSGQASDQDWEQHQRALNEALQAITPYCLTWRRVRRLMPGKPPAHTEARPPIEPGQTQTP